MPRNLGRELPEDGELRVGGVGLPAGRRVLAGYGSGGPVAWATVQPVRKPGGVWQALSQLTAETGLVPFLLGGLNGSARRPWDDGEFDDPVDISPVADMDAGEVLAGLWRDKTWELSGTAPKSARAAAMRREIREIAASMAERGPIGFTMPLRSADGPGGAEDEDDGDGDGGGVDPELAAAVAPFGREFPGLAPPGDQSLPGREVSRLLRSLPPARIGLAPASRPADVAPLIGWDRTGEPALIIAAVLRSWEERFDARLLRVGFSELQVLARRPPRTRQAAQLLAAEHFAFCDECGGRGMTDVPSISGYLMNSPVWTFWWD
jgi:Domain of unknown function (DUF4253)